MGGERETEVAAKKEPKEKKDKVSVGKYRIHQKDAEVHIHDDTNKLKAAVPVARWWKMWEEVRTRPGKIEPYGDPVHKTLLTLECVVDQGTIDVTINIAAATFGDNWEKIDTFTKKK